MSEPTCQNHKIYIREPTCQIRTVERWLVVLLTVRERPGGGLECAFIENEHQNCRALASTVLLIIKTPPLSSENPRFLSLTVWGVLLFQVLDSLNLGGSYYFEKIFRQNTPIFFGRASRALIIKAKYHIFFRRASRAFTIAF